MPMLTSPSLFALPLNPQPTSGILTWFPFDIGWLNITCIKELTYVLGSSHPWPIAVSMEPFSTSAFKVSIWIFATTTKIYTKGSSTKAHAIGFYTTLTPSYTLLPQYFCNNGRVSVTNCSAINFQGWRVRWVSCYTLLSWCRLPWPQSHCLYPTTPFKLSD